MSHEAIDPAGPSADRDDALQVSDGGLVAACAYCRSNSGIYDVSARCCKVRLVANMPRKLRLAYYGKLQREFGADVARDMADAVKLFHVIASE